MDADGMLGSRAVWGRVGYRGDAFAPWEGTYLLGGPAALTTRADAGERLGLGRGVANLSPLVAAAAYEAGFAFEAGPLSTWTN